ncbi:hypothetical protein F511_39724 [Dorcoceras hygrometricum]|uniref:Uncharacterized protein n=1 Tax=Dorcoceras hygrometricum TaxID=472368 RepID=A0A2Z7D2N8_9LAMI|nr:hypothetical protein F511_39724 [Dorcoceras hygrometricum]
MKSDVSKLTSAESYHHVEELEHVGRRELESTSECLQPQNTRQRAPERCSGNSRAGGKASVNNPELRVCLLIALAFDDVGKADTAVLGPRVPRSEEIFDLPPVITIVEASSSGKGSERIPPFDPSKDSLVASPSAVMATRYICNMAPDQDLKVLKRADDAEAVGHFAANIASAIAWGGGVVKRLTRAHRKMNASRKNFYEAMGRHAEVITWAQEEGAAKAQREALEAELAAEKEARAIEREALVAELEKANAWAGQEAERLKSEAKEEFLESPGFDALLAKKAWGYFKDDLWGCLAQFRANGYSEEEHPASFLDLQQALAEVGDEEEAEEEEEEEEEEKKEEEGGEERFIVALCHHIKIIPSQLASNSYSFLLALAVLLSYHKLPLIPYVLMQLVQIKMLGLGKFYISHKGDHTFIKGNPSSHKGWMSSSCFPRTNLSLVSSYADERMGKTEILRAMQEEARASWGVAPPKKTTKKRKAPSLVEKEVHRERRKKGASASGTQLEEPLEKSRAQTPPAFRSEEIFDLSSVITIVEASSSGKGSERIPPFDPSKDSLVASPSAIVATRYICNMAPDQDLQVLKRADDAEAVGHFAANIASAMSQHAEAVARLEELEVHRARELEAAKTQLGSLGAELAAEKEARATERDAMGAAMVGLMCLRRRATRTISSKERRFAPSSVSTPDVMSDARALSPVKVVQALRLNYLATSIGAVCGKTLKKEDKTPPKRIRAQGIEDTSKVEGIFQDRKNRGDPFSNLTTAPQEA